MMNFENQKRQGKKRPVKDKPKYKQFKDDDISLQNRANKEYKQKKRYLREEDTWEELEDYE